MAVENNLTMFAGETKTITVTCTSSTTGAAIDFSGSTLTSAWKVKRTVNGTTTTYITKTPTASGGTLTIDIATGDTATMSGTYSHELRVTLADSSVITFAYGTLTVKPTISGA